MAKIRIPNIDESGNFTNPDVIARLGERLGRGSIDAAGVDAATRATLAAGTLVDPANSVAPWTRYALNGTTIAALDPDPAQGRFLRLTPGPTGSTNRIVRAVNLDLSQSFLSIPIRVNGPGLSKLELVLGSRTTTLSQSILVGGNNIRSQDLVVGRWNLITFDLTTAFRTNAPIADDTDIRDLGFFFQTIDGTTTVDFGQIRIHPRANLNRKIIWQFDDGRADTYTTTYPILSEAGYVGSLPVEIDTIGAPGRMTLPQIREVYDAGWEVVGHHGQQIPSMTDAAARVEFEKIVDLHDAEGWTRGRDFFIWPGGIWDTAKEAIALEYFTHLRRVSSMVSNPTPWATNRYSVPLSYITMNTTLATVKASMDRAAVSGGNILFVTHSILDAPAAGSADWPVDRFQAAVDYAVSLGLESTTLQAMYATGV